MNQHIFWMCAMTNKPVHNMAALEHIFKFVFSLFLETQVCLEALIVHSPVKKPAVVWALVEQPWDPLASSPCKILDTWVLQLTPQLSPTVVVIFKSFKFYPPTPSLEA